MALEGLAGKVAVVTGAAGGIGAATARRLSSEGVLVVAVDADPAGAERVAGALPSEALAVAADVAAEADVDSYVAATVARFGRIDLHHLNAGIAGTLAPLTDIVADDFDRVVAVNLRGVFLGLRAAFRQYATQATGGAIVTTASIAGLRGAADLVPYHASKHGVIGLTRGAAVYGGPLGVRVNAVAPGIVPTGLLGSPAGSGPGAANLAARAGLAPLGRPGTPDEIASVVAFLLSDEAAFLTGEIVSVDGGAAALNPLRPSGAPVAIDTRASIVGSSDNVDRLSDKAAMKAALLVEVGAPLVVEEVELLPPSPTHVIVRMTASALCYTDCMNRRGDLVKQLPTILGHAGIGVVEEVGAAVSGVAIGERVVVPGTPECGVCYWCARGRPDQCADLAVGQPHVANRRNGEEVTSSGGGGTYAELMRVPRSWIFPVESSLSDEELSLLGCGITTGLGAVFNAAAVEPGSSVAVVGCGHLGLWMVQGAQAAGAAQVIAVDPNDQRRARAGGLGATDLVDPAEGDPVEQVRELTEGRGSDYVLEAAGAPDAQLQAFMMARKAGTVVLTGIERFDSTVTLPQFELALRGKSLHSCQNGKVRMRRDIPRFVRMLEDGVVDAKPIISGVYPLEEINQALDAAESYENLTGVIVP